jgi:hypothetical protein
MKAIKWFGAALLGAAGVAILLLGAPAQALVIRDRPAPVVLTGAVRAAAAALVSSCWDGGLGEVDKATIARVDDTGMFHVTIFGARTLTAAEAWAKAQLGQKIKGDRSTEERINCTVTTAAQRTALTALAAAVWPRPMATLRGVLLQKTEAGIEGRAEGYAVITQAEANARLAAGLDIDPVGVPQ